MSGRAEVAPRAAGGLGPPGPVRAVGAPRGRVVLAEDGRKMSKRLKNYPDPVYILNAYGADSLRLYLINSPVVHAEDLKFKEDGVKQGKCLATCAHSATTHYPLAP